MRSGITILPEHPWSVAATLWKRAEEYGFDHAWTYDHLSWRSLADGPWHATIPTLTAAAMATARIRLGTFVASPNFRHPVPFAKELATVDEISGGRFTLGVGSGGTGFDATVFGDDVLPARARHARFESFVTALDQLLRHETDGPISFSDDWYTAHEARMVGTPAQEPRMPFVIAANGPKGQRLAARYGSGWLTTGAGGDDERTWWRRTGDLMKRFQDAAGAAGRRDYDAYVSIDAGPVYSLSSAEAYRDAVGRAAELGFTDTVCHWPRPDGVYSGSEAVLDEIAPARE
ncbi:LLM class flavin-dependent oxidoreductase [Spelaeicoccus albus]|uniref:Alkanesulfonate monooxygenase SsuD/methylene tetrahydromethanopterin reductase-like flavin-dependent oxidoreductase (Luciferase family) n=1 Tax=Spelaeicoccus albus TaxID=1280376 RepID=A0A7Z0D3Q6_9MICO|nr:LLM class flavin-dependent oxidoreductase [Spelaeicoccus albus]NYI68321.1 alkanesulfonate monooxygenase SsuD/methylene tetrahydromethanopterin reductase-like flavin-dependent oxidoreductase (luciferase family) [Spelaeicoccus albus]